MKPRMHCIVVLLLFSLLICGGVNGARLSFDESDNGKQSLYSQGTALSSPFLRTRAPAFGGTSKRQRGLSWYRVPTFHQARVASVPQGPIFGTSW